MKPIKLNILQYFIAFFSVFAFSVSCTSDIGKEEQLDTNSNSNSNMQLNTQYENSTLSINNTIASDVNFIVNSGQILAVEIEKRSISDIEMLDQPLVDTLMGEISYAPGEVKLSFVNSVFGDLNYFNDNGIEAGMEHMGYSQDVIDIAMQIVNGGGIKDLHSITGFDEISNNNQYTLALVNGIVFYFQNNLSGPGTLERMNWGVVFEWTIAGAFIGGLIGSVGGDEENGAGFYAGAIIGGIIGFTAGLVAGAVK